MENETRKEALEWWHGMDAKDQVDFVEMWKNSDPSEQYDNRKTWDLMMIQSSSSCIEQIYLDLGIKEFNK